MSDSTNDALKQVTSRDALRRIDRGVAEPAALGLVCDMFRYSLQELFRDGGFTRGLGAVEDEVPARYRVGLQRQSQPVSSIHKTLALPVGGGGRRSGGTTGTIC